ncbi:hypothetical protein Vadar_013968 [Vaccinium darrowii]|uniref:Uncharacterized protein n=1 Tax=Vaccinium darrowii TaxID=229202 RepID=A0ACB7XI21_9ERIC|nr:hypothetical protein Vadar_013968 [Vaccinium darrowii]
MENWAELHQDILILIAKRVRFWEDFSTFRRVCRSWRSVAVKKNFKGCPQFPWLMLAEENNSDHRGLVSATEGNVIGKLLLPEAKGKRCFESLGWLITVSETGDMNLLDPVSRVQIHLPHISTFKNHPEGNDLTTYFGYIRKAVLSSRPCVSSKDTNYVLMVIHESFRHLGFWRPGDKVWTNVETRGRDPIVVAHLCLEIPREVFKFKRPYIVESNGELLVVVRDGYDQDYLGDYVTLGEDEVVDVCCGTTEFGVFKVDLSNWEWVELQSLGDNVLFVGDNDSISVRASEFHGIRPNCIYFTENFGPQYIYVKPGGGEDMCMYDMEDRSVDLYYVGGSFSPMCPPLWVRPYF